MHAATAENSMSVTQKVSYHMAQQIPLLGIYTKELKTGTQVNKYLYANIHHTAVFTNAKGRNNQSVYQ